MVTPTYAEFVIAGVLFKGIWRWYVTDKEHWIMDMVKWEEALLKSGYEVYGPGDYSERFDIGILDESSAVTFLSKIENQRVLSSDLTEMILKFDLALGEEILAYFPTFFVDFDQGRFYSLYPEMFEFERYVPDGWVGEYRDFMGLVPKAEQYWMHEGTNQLLAIWNELKK